MTVTVYYNFCCKINKYNPYYETNPKKIDTFTI